MSLSERCAAEIADFAAALAATADGHELSARLDRLLCALPLNWYALHSSSPDGHARRVRSRGYPARLRDVPPTDSVATAGDPPLPDNELAILVAGPAPGIDALICRVSLKSALSGQHAIKRALATLLRQALLRLLNFEAERRRAVVLRQLPEPHRRHVFVFSHSGQLLDRWPADAAPGPDAVMPYVRDVCQKGGGGAARRGVIEVEGQVYELRCQWIRDPSRRQRATLAVEARPRTTITALLDASFERYTLTRRERDVAQQLLLGLSNQEIAAHLCVSADTVKTHCQHLFAKMEITRRSEVLKALRRNELPGNPPAIVIRPPQRPLTFARRPVLSQFWQGRYVRMDGGVAFLTDLKDGHRIRIEKGAVGYCYAFGGTLSLGFNRDMKPPSIPAFGTPRFDYRVLMEARLVPFLSVSLD